MSKSKKKTWHLAVFLLSEDCKTAAAALRKEVAAQHYPLTEGSPFKGEIVIGPTQENEPRWVNLLRSGSAKPIHKLKNTSSRALLLLHSDKRLFAVSFGYGRYMLKESAYHRDFGFRTTVNIVDPDKLRSIDASKLEELTIHTTTQASRISPFGTFGVDVLNDLMRAVTGEPSDPRFGKTISGRDCAVINVKLDFNDIADKVHLLFQGYQSDRYKARFDWIDNLAAERDPSTLRQLDALLLNALTSKDTSKMHVAPPEAVDWADIEGLGFSKKPDQLNLDPNPEELISSFGGPSEITIEQLKRKRLYVKYASSDALVPQWSAYRCIVHEASLNQSVYVLTLGDWYRVESSFADSIRNFVRALPDCSLAFPVHGRGSTEDAYNRRVASTGPGMISLHGKTLKCESARTPIEVCDLFSRDGQLIHVKKKDASSTLSHLFAQGRISASSLLRDAELRKSFRDVLGAAGFNPDPLIPIDRLDPSKLEVVFAVIDGSTRPLHESLPFFSLLNLRQAAEFLTPLGFRVTKKQIVSK
jgi:uncharacterized protein (TIGR04141 family)